MKVVALEVAIGAFLIAMFVVAVFAIGG